MVKLLKLFLMIGILLFSYAHAREYVINEGGSPTIDFRIESGDYTHFFFLQASGNYYLLGSMGTNETGTIASFNFSVTGADAQRVFNIYGASAEPVITFYQAEGDFGAYSGSLNNAKIGGLEVVPRATTAFASAPRAGIFLRAAQDTTDTAQGTYIDFQTTSANTTTMRETMRLNPDGLIIPFVSTTTPNGTEGGFFYHDTHNHWAFFNGSAWRTISASN